MALKDISIGISATGVDQTVQGFKKVEDGASSMGKGVGSATGKAAADLDRMMGSVGNTGSATGKAAADLALLESAAGSLGGAVSLAGKLLAGFGIGFTVAGIIHGIHSAIEVIDQFEVSVIQIAAQLTQMEAGSGKGGNLGKTFQASAAYAEVLADKMQEIDANSFASNKGLMAMLQTMTMQGVVLDVNNKAQVETFTALSNAVAMYTAGQDQEIQARQEMRALMSGEVNQHSQLSRIIDTQIKQQGIYKGGLKEVVELGQEHGDTLQRLAPYLQGVNAASESINKTWSAASSSLETAVNKVTREGFAEVFHDIVPWVSQFAAHLKEGSGVSEVVHKSWLALKGSVSAVLDVLSVFSAPLHHIGEAAKFLLDKFGLLVSSVLPVLADEFKHLIGLLNACVNLGYSFGAVMLDAVGAMGSAVLSVGKAALQALTGDFEGAKASLSAMFSGTYAERLKDNMTVVKGTIIAVNEEWRAMQDPMGRIADKANQYLTTMQKAKASATAPTPPKPPAAETDPLDLEAYGREAEKFREAYRALYAAQDKATLQDARNATASELAELENRHKLGLIAERDYLDKRHQIRAAESDRDIATLQAAAERAQEALDKAQQSVGAKPADGADADQVDRWNQSVLVSIRTAKEFAEAMAKVSDAVAKAKLEDNKDQGATDLHAQAMQRYADEQAVQRLQIEGNRLAAEALANEIKYADLKKKGYTEEEIGLTRVNDQLKIAADLYARELASYKQLRELQDQNATASASLAGTNSFGGFDSIADQTANAMAVQEDAHRQRMQQIQDEQDANLSALMAQQQSYEDYINKRIELDKKAGIENQKHNNATTAITQASFTSQLRMAGEYVSMGSQLFAGLAATQDQSSRKGFETAKNMNLGAAVMGTAAATIGQLTGADAWTPMAWARAGTAATLGAMQIATIASTEFGGGGSAAAPSLSGGSFGGGGGAPSSAVGSKIGAPIQYGIDAAGSDAVARLAAAADSAVLAVGDLTASFKSASKAFSSGGQGASQVDRVVGLAAGPLDPTHAGPHADAVSGIVDQGIATIRNAAAALGTSVGTPTITPTGWQGDSFSAENVEKTMNNMLASVLNDYAKAVAGLEEYAKPGEDAAIALQRLSGALYTVDKEFDKLGITLLSGLAGANIASKLQEAFSAKGEDLAKAMDNYFTGLFTDEEQQAMKAAEASRKVSSAFDLMGLAVPKTNAEFIALVNSLDLTSATGQSTFASLMSVSEAFGIVTKQADELKKKQDELNKAQGELDRDLTSRLLKLGNTDAAGLYDLAQQQTKELAEARDKGLDTTVLLTVQSLEYAAALDRLVESQQAARLSFQDGIQSRLLKAADLGNAADLLTMLVNREKELAAAREKGYDVTALLAVQQTEYAQKLLQLQQAAQQKQLDAQLAFNDLVNGARDKVTSAQKAYDNAVAAQAKQAQTETLNAQLATVQAAKSAWQSAADSIKGALSSIASDLISDPVQQAASLRGQFSTLTRSALSGDAGAAGQLGELGQSYAAALKASSTSREAYQLEVGKLQASLSRVQTLAASRGTAAERQEALLQGQLDALNRQTDTSVADAAAALKTAQSELEALATLGLETADVRKSATQAAAEALEQARSDYQATLNLQGTVDAQLAQHKAASDQAHLDALNIVASLDVVGSSVASLASLQSLTSLANKSADNYLMSAGLPQYASGTPYVNGDQLAQIHDREIILDAQSSEILRRYGIKVQGDGSIDSREVVRAIASLDANMTELRAELKAALYAIAKNTGDSVRQLRPCIEGDTLKVVVAA